jgi:hypothetical protein
VISKDGVEWSEFFTSNVSIVLSFRGASATDSGFVLCPHTLERLIPIRMATVTKVSADRIFRSLKRNSRYI